MYIKRGNIGISHTGTSYIGFISYNKRSCNRVNRHTCTFIVVTDSRYDSSDLVCRHTKIIEDSESHYCTTLRVIHSVNKIADIVQISRYSCKLNSSFIIPESLENVGGIFRNLANMGEAMLGVSECLKRLVRFGYISSNIFVIFDFFKSYHIISH